MKKILFIAYNFPPEGGPAVQRVSKFIKYLHQFDYRVIVLTSNHKYSIVDETLLKDIPEDTVVHKSLDYGNYVPGDIRNKFLKNYFVPDKQVFWKKSALKKVKEIIRNNDIDVIISTSPPHSAHLIGLEIKKKYNIPLIVDFRDEWTMNPSFADFHNKSKNRD